MTEKKRFWEEKSLAEMTDTEWERLCDGCGRCCLVKLEDEETGKLYYSQVACEFFDLSACRCSVYGEREEKMPGCLSIRKAGAEVFSWLPWSCAYRRLHEGRPLADWHPLVSGDDKAMHEKGISVKDLAISPEGVSEADFEDLLVEFVDEYEEEGLL